MKRSAVDPGFDGFYSCLAKALFKGAASSLLSFAGAIGRKMAEKNGERPNSGLPPRTPTHVRPSQAKARTHGFLSEAEELLALLRHKAGGRPVFMQNQVSSQGLR